MVTASGAEPQHCVHCAGNRENSVLPDTQIQNTNKIIRKALRNPSKSSHRRKKRKRFRGSCTLWLEALIARSVQSEPNASHLPDTRNHSGCRIDHPCAVKTLLDTTSRDLGLPLDLLYAVAKTESDWHHWRRGRIVGSDTGDFGIMQINRIHSQVRYSYPVSSKKSTLLTWKQIQFDVQANVRYGASILLACLRLASLMLYGVPPESLGEDKKIDKELLYQTAYACYNGGPGAMKSRVARIKKSGGIAQDKRFKKVFGKKLWKDHLVRTPCEPPRDPGTGDSK